MNCAVDYVKNQLLIKNLKQKWLLAFYKRTLYIILIEVNRDYPQNSLVFFPNKWCSFEPFMGSAAYQLAKDVGYFSLPLYLLRLYWRLRDTVPHSAGILPRPVPER